MRVHPTNHAHRMWLSPVQMCRQVQPSMWTWQCGVHQHMSIARTRMQDWKVYWCEEFQWLWAWRWELCTSVGAMLIGGAVVVCGLCGQWISTPLLCLQEPSHHCGHLFHGPFHLPIYSLSCPLLWCAVKKPVDPIGDNTIIPMPTDGEELIKLLTVEMVARSLPHLSHLL